MIELGPPTTWTLPMHLRLFHGIYADDIVKATARRKDEKAAAYRKRLTERKAWEAAELNAAHAWAHGEDGRIAIPHTHNER